MCLGTDEIQNFTKCQTVYIQEDEEECEERAWKLKRFKGREISDPLMVFILMQ